MNKIDLKKRYIRNKKYDLTIEDRFKAFYKSSIWKKIRNYVLKRDNFTCQCCAKKGNIVHHLIKVRKEWSKRFETKQLITVCQACHNKIHKSKGGEPEWEMQENQ